MPVHPAKAKGIESAETYNARTRLVKASTARVHVVKVAMGTSVGGVHRCTQKRKSEKGHVCV